MKKLLASLLVLAMCAPAMALTLSTSATDNVLTISYDLAEGEVLRGLALTVTASVGDGAVAASTDYTAPAFNTFMDWAADVDNTYTTVGQGHPFAMVTPDVVNGQYEAAFPATSFALSLGYLDENGVDPKGEGITEDGVITVTFDGTLDTTVAVALDTFRGGAVGDNLVIDAAGLVDQIVKFPSDVCMGDFNGDGAITGADVSGLVATFGLLAGQPGYNALGDFNGDDAVTGADISGFVAVFGTNCP